MADAAQLNDFLIHDFRNSAVNISNLLASEEMQMEPVSEPWTPFPDTLRAAQLPPDPDSTLLLEPTARGQSVDRPAPVRVKKPHGHGPNTIRECPVTKPRRP